MSITEAQARRALRHADIPWDREVEDPREDAWVVHDLCFANTLSVRTAEPRGPAAKRGSKSYAGRRSSELGGGAELWQHSLARSPEAAGRAAASPVAGYAAVRQV
jgi:hypothetical protein